MLLSSNERLFHIFAPICLTTTHGVQEHKCVPTHTIALEAKLSARTLSALDLTTTRTSDALYVSQRASGTNAY